MPPLHVFIILLSLNPSESYKKKDYVIEENDDHFPDTLSTHETVLVLFHTPWCQNCQRIKPELSKAADYLHKRNPGVALAALDCTVDGVETCRTQQIMGYPTLKLFRHGEFVEQYSGGRDAENLIKYMEIAGIPSSTNLKTKKEFDAFLQTDEVCVIGFFAEDTETKSLFLKVAAKMRGKAKFAHTNQKSVLERVGRKNNIILYRPGYMHSTYEDDSVLYLGQEENEKDLVYFILRNFHGLVGHRTSGNRDDFRLPLVVGYYNVDYVRNPKGTNFWRQKMLKVAKHYRHTVHFAISNKDEFRHELEEVGVEFWKGDVPLIIATDQKSKRYKMTKEFTRHDLLQFVMDLMAGKLKPHVVSAPLKEYNEDFLKIAVGNNFERVVLENDRDTMVFFYNPGGDEINQILPIYRVLAEKFYNDGIVFVKMDAVANQVPHFLQVDKFPTFYWLKKGRKDQPVKYEGGWSLNDFIKFISELSDVELNGYDRKGEPKSKLLKKTEL